MIENGNKISFRKAVISDLELLKRWFQKPHVQEFWDNSPEMWQNVISYLNDNKILYDYWIGSFEDRPFCLIITSDASESDPFVLSLIPIKTFPPAVFAKATIVLIILSKLLVFSLNFKVFPSSC